MSKNQLETINKDLISYLLKSGITNACYYEPQIPTEYWNNKKKKIAFCNLEPYSVYDNEDTIKGLKPLDGERFFNHWFFNRTVGMTVFINYLLNLALYEYANITESFAKEINWQLKNSEEGYDKLCDSFSNSMYFNFRYTQSTNIKEDTIYIYEKYTNDSFYKQHYRNFVNAAEVDILIISGNTGAGLIPIIYPELKGKFYYCGDPVRFNNTIFVSMPHPSRISWKARVDVVNKIIQEIYQ